MISELNPNHGLIGAFIIIISVYLFSVLWVGAKLLVDPTKANAIPGPAVKPDASAPIQYKCKNGYLYFVVNGVETRVSSDTPNVCAQEMSNTNGSNTTKANPSH